MFGQIKNIRLAGFATLAKAGAGVALLSLVTCSSQRDFSEGVQLILNTEGLEPTTTFELRFDQIVAAPQEVGQRATNSPLIISPHIAGNFVWLSQRSGLFTPSEPAGLGETYRFSLRPGFKIVGQVSRLPSQNAAGETPVSLTQPVRVRLHRTLRAPPLCVTDMGASEMGSSNASSEPEVRVQFNAEIKASEAKSFLEFRSASGMRVPAEVRQATASGEASRREYVLPSGKAMRALLRARPRRMTILVRTTPGTAECRL